MKLFVLVAVLCSTFVVAFGAVKRSVEQEPTFLSEAEASKQCNASYPITEDPRQKLTRMVINGETIPRSTTFDDPEWCHLNCILEKVGFYGADGQIRVRKVFKYVLQKLPELKSTSPNLMMFLFHINRATAGMPNKCSKSLIAYYKFTEAIMIATLAADLDANPAVKEKSTEAALNDLALPTELNNSVQKAFKNVELFFQKTVENSANSTSPAAPATTS